MYKTCINCNSWRYYEGEPAYGEMTPGVDSQTYCALGHWRLRLWWTTQDEYREYLLTAQTCDEFDPIYDKLNPKEPAELL